MPASLVIDAGLAFRAIVPNPAQTAIQELLADWRKREAVLVVPTLWLYEVTSAIAKAVHFEVMTEAEGRQALVLANRLEVRLVPPDAALALAAYDWTRRLSRAAAYDSFYLALAESLACDLWTADARLQAAAGLPWVKLPRV